jgi:hypothetical protein
MMSVSSEPVDVMRLCRQRARGREFAQGLLGDKAEEKVAHRRVTAYLQELDKEIEIQERLERDRVRELTAAINAQ